tara:strand:+ start:541 stop:1602 length:1062 start_codon:yes stop_codon:yes gene_type:complete
MYADTIVVSSYNNFKNLAHQPKGIPCNVSLLILKNDLYKLQEVLGCYNPAFILKHPTEDLLYICCESIYKGNIITVSYDVFFNFKILGNIETGKSTCYLELDFELKNLLVVNYWDSEISIHPLVNDIPQKSIFNLPANLKFNDRKNHLIDRQSESHNHSLTLFKTKSNQDIAFVPDLGLDLIRIFNYKNNKLIPNSLIKLEKNSGPRYISVLMDHIYIVNELNSTVIVFQIIEEVDKKITVKKVQIISTIPNDYNQYNTCGNICIDNTKKYLVVSNRGHNSLAVYKIDYFILTLVSINSSNGKTPRHFCFTKSNNIVISNQDSGTIDLFNFYEGNLIYVEKINVNSPNFVLSI